MNISRKVWISLICLFVFVGIAAAQYPAEKPSVESGKAIYKSKCVMCHGNIGSAIFEFNDHGSMVEKTSTDFYNAVTDGIMGTEMHAFTDLSESQRWDVVAYLWTFWLDEPRVEEGKTIFTNNCRCHGANGDGSGLSGAFDFTDLEVMVNKKPEGFIEIVSNGVPNTQMASWSSRLSDDEILNVVERVWTFQFSDYPPSPDTAEMATGTELMSPPESTEAPEAAASAPASQVPLGTGILFLTVTMAYLVARIRKS
ncbi:MAG: c-type cytochrome [Methanosarcinaceae archaeon]|nr:c-type cytochrome [Methanosarcinaceae archaeon]